MKISHFLKYFDNIVILSNLIESEKDLLEKINDKYFYKSENEAKYNLLTSDDLTHSYVKNVDFYKLGVCQAILLNKTSIKNWLDDEQNNLLILNKIDSSIPDMFLSSFSKIGYNFTKISNFGEIYIESRNLRGLQVTLEKDKENIYIKEVVPNPNIQDFYPFKDNSAKDVREDYEREQRIESARTRLKKSLIAINLQSEIENDKEELEEENEKE